METEVITDEYLKPVMEEVTSEVAKIYPRKPTPEQKRSLSCFLMTLSNITSDIFHWLPPQEASAVITACGTWFDVGMLFGKSPELLVKILDKVNPTMNKVELPDCLAGKLGGEKTSGQ